MKQRTPEKFSTSLVDWSPFVIKPPRDPDDDEADEDEEDDDDDESDEPAVVREPDED